MQYAAIGIAIISLGLGVFNSWSNASNRKDAEQAETMADFAATLSETIAAHISAGRMRERLKLEIAKIHADSEPGSVPHTAVNEVHEADRQFATMIDRLDERRNALLSLFDSRDDLSHASTKQLRSLREALRTIRVHVDGYRQLCESIEQELDLEQS